MSNEEIVERIRNGFSVTDDMQRLYENNLPLIKRIVKPYTVYEPMEDCLQEAYFGLLEATKHYEASEGILFMTYASHWIKQAVQQYVTNCGSVLRIPSQKRQQIARYKKTVQELSQELGRTPTDHETAKRMCVSEKLLPLLKIYSQGVASLDTPLADDDSLTLSDTLQADLSIENETIDKIYKEHSENELWDIVERHTDHRENDILIKRYKDNMTFGAIAEKEGMTNYTVRQIEFKALGKLRRGKAKKELLEKFDVVDAGIYRNGFCKFKEHNRTSTVEYIAVRRTEIEAEYRERLKRYRQTFEMGKRACL